MSKKGSIISATLNLITLALVVYLAYRLYNIGFFNSLLNGISSNSSATTIVPPAGNFTTIPANGTSQASTFANYMLQLINKDRHQNGLQNVTLSNETSAQQHAISMLQYNYFSHWDIFGLKPYMRYTLLKGNGSVTENVAYQSGSACVSFICSGNINPTNALQGMEYNMMYNDSACCDNGHRNNILDLYHNQVSIGIAYNSSTIYLVEDFVDSYISWTNSTPSYANGEVYLAGNVSPTYSISSFMISYDSPVTNLTSSQLSATKSYSYGSQVAGVVKSSSYYYTNLTTIVADSYLVSGQKFNLEFNMQNLIKKYGAGEYTILLWMAQPSGITNSFVGATYTIFINSQGDAYVPSQI